MICIEISIYTLDIHGTYRDLNIYHVQETEKQQKQQHEKHDFSFYAKREKGISVVSGVSVWDTFGMNTDVILAKSWIQTPKTKYYNRFDECLTFFGRGSGIYFCAFWGAVGFCTSFFFFWINKKKTIFWHKFGRLLSAW